jgi:hypothetical protein
MKVARTSTSITQESPSFVTQEFGNVVVAPRFVEQAIRWVVTRMHPLSEVESESFRSMMQAASPRPETLTRCRVRCEILKLVHQIKTRLRSKFKDADMKCAITTDAWTSKGGEGYICLTLHFIDEAWEVQSLCTGLLHVGTEGVLIVAPVS